MEIEKLIFNVDYIGPLNAEVDWVAGGNFDGYIARVSLRFLKEDKKVIKTVTILNDSHYDAQVADAVIHGNFYESDKGTITCAFPHFEMRGKILGNSNEYLAFSLFISGIEEVVTECYLLP